MKQIYTSTWHKQLPIIGTVHFARHPKAKRISIKVTPTGKIRVTLPRRVSRKTASRFALNNHDWILRARSRALQRIRAHTHLPLNPRQFQDKVSAAQFLVERLAHLAQKFQFSYERVTVRQQKTIWGSCSSKNNISLNIHLVRLPDPLIDYVMLHELTHTHHKDHSAAFWSKLRNIVPELDRLRQLLKQYHPRLLMLLEGFPTLEADPNNMS